MQQIKEYSMEWGGRTLTIEFNRYAGQANASCTVRYGDTMALVTAVMSDQVRPDVSYFPLMVEFSEKMYAAGKISGSRFIKREGRPSDDAVLSSRLIDRAIRPLFTESISNDIQILISMLAYDEESDPDVVGMVGAAAALMVSDIPWDGPLAGCSVAVKDGEMTMNPGKTARTESDFNVFVAGRDELTVMVEADGAEASEDETYKAIEFGVKEMQPVVEFLKKIQSEIGLEKIVIKAPELSDEDKKLKELGEAKGAEHYAEHGAALFGPTTKRERRIKQDVIMDALKAKFADEEAVAAKFAAKKFATLFQEEMITRIFTDGKRVDDRKLDELRELSAEVDLIPRVHGSGLFNRGDTQILSITTLSSPSAEQIIDTMRIDEKRRYFHHYNFPPFSVGEAKPMRSAGRREIGHGILAEKAIIPVLPSKEEFPYTIRVVSEVLSSNGSSSQGSICGSSLSLMAAGVPITSAVAGIAMGIAFKDAEAQDEYVLLTDMKDVEDYEASMDFKVAGTRKGITAIQLDMKFGGMTLEMVEKTLEGAKVARGKILDQMDKAISTPREELSDYAPRVQTMKIDPERIGELIGPGGKIINAIIDKTGASIDIEDDGTVFIASEDGEAMKQTIAIIEDIFRTVEVGEVYNGKVVKILTDRNDTNKEIGAIVQLTNSKDGMVHISEIAHDRINKVSDVIKEGEIIKVKVIAVDKMKGRISLSRREVLDATDSAATQSSKPTNKNPYAGDL